MITELIIEIFKENETLDIREGVSNSREWKQITQIGYAYLGQQFPLQCKIKIKDGQPFYKAGKYKLDMTSFYIGKYGDITLGRDMILIPVE